MLLPMGNTVKQFNCERKEFNFMQQLEGDWNRELVSSASNQNINACIAIADVLKSTLGPSGMDKLLIDKRGNMLITNDGATILRHLKVEQPAAVLLVELAMAQVSFANLIINV